MAKIIAIGGGQKLKSGFSVKAPAVDREIMNLSKKDSPRFLFIPTASSDAESYIKDIKHYFGKILKCNVDALCLYDKLSNKEIRSKISNADIIYVGGGNTLKMMKLWKKTGIDELLKKAARKGTVLSGVSAGGICWFRYGNSDSRRFRDPKSDLIKVKGLDIIPILFCPHYDTEKDRKADLKKMMKKTPGVAIAVDNCCAIEIIDDTFRIIASSSNANAYKVYWKLNKYYEKKLEKSKNYKKLDGLIIK
jgi:dipeptidase E